MRDWAVGMESQALRTALLRSVAEAACVMTGGRAASVALLDEANGELVFVAASGPGSEDLVGARFPAAEGIAGHVALTGEPTEVRNVWRDVHFARDIAAEVGYEPDAITAVPVMHGGHVDGVLSVLDATNGNGDLCAMLAPLAQHAAAALDLSAELERKYV
jgi:GAF domain-containing protein